MCKGSPRSVVQLKAQWGLLKMKAKKMKSEEKKELTKTGGGPPPVIPGVSSEDISSWLPNEFVTDNNEFDSDSINQMRIRPPEEKIKEVTVVPPPNAASPEKIKEMTVAAPSKPSPGASGSKPKKNTILKKKVLKVCRTQAEQIADLEMQCRKELHSIQMENENQKIKFYY
ncbi:uncharacterized protein LOC119189358 [Manduca sexta]|uniref:uncharacterized protein LOC119189358 n=1 Tax=Manduca sexta TaxID=7130 RepID=UPI00188E9D21|nr:uncharacterized protein LOC119189358 [Manduca sexta]